ncbi:hypothetical protein B0I37DRAFT_906 [Chaetomium sp. MPI-CAGE-AT-0009]|nr:hypothetical protein B0I37DRAFT_906 [Chaetomium sp. MPI-CAGE-AT-0009]
MSSMSSSLSSTRWSPIDAVPCPRFSSGDSHGEGHGGAGGDLLRGEWPREKRRVEVKQTIESRPSGPRFNRATKDQTRKEKRNKFDAWEASRQTSRPPGGMAFQKAVPLADVLGSGVGRAGGGTDRQRETSIGGNSWTPLHVAKGRRGWGGCVCICGTQAVATPTTGLANALIAVSGQIPLGFAEPKTSIGQDREILGRVIVGDSREDEFLFS